MQHCYPSRWAVARARLEDHRRCHPRKSKRKKCQSQDNASAEHIKSGVSEVGERHCDRPCTGNSADSLRPVRPSPPNRQAGTSAEYVGSTLVEADDGKRTDDGDSGCHAMGYYDIFLLPPARTELPRFFREDELQDPCS